MLFEEGEEMSANPFKYSLDNKRYHTLNLDEIYMYAQREENR